MMRSVKFASSTLLVLATGKSDGTCGYECKVDTDCSGCGTSGKCGCPDGKDAQFANISCSCISAPANAPKDPAATIDAAAWPAQWRANVDGYVYSDFTSKAATANGTFYYDATLGKTRADWKPYTNGKDATQVWIVDGSQSHYYVKSGPLCIYFPITDPGQNGKPGVGVERADWMKNCNDAGFAKYVGREQVNVNGEDEWVDHWSCHLDYTSAKQEITFQNFHSLGLGKVPKGLPVRVTGGNSAPNGQKGSPRLSSVWYKDFVTGPTATSPDDFKKPGLLCIPVGAEEKHAFFGHEVTAAHTWSPQFHRRAHYLAHAKASGNDLRRAKQPKPRSAFRGETFTKTMMQLNSILQKDGALQTRRCADFSLDELHRMQTELFHARTHELDDVYQRANDTRKMSHTSLESLEAEQQRNAAITELALLAKVRDGACHEMVMWYIHHLSDSARNEIKSELVLPLLPETQHGPPVETSESEAQAHARYTAQASCAVCHVSPSKTVVV